MAKTIEFEYEGENYTLEYTRRTIKDMESKGFSLAGMTKMPMTMYPMLFAGAFKCHHPQLKQSVIDSIYKHLSGKEALAESLVDMYNSSLDTLFDEPEEGEKNVKWKANF